MFRPKVKMMMKVKAKAEVKTFFMNVRKLSEQDVA